MKFAPVVTGLLLTGFLGACGVSGVNSDSSVKQVMIKTNISSNLQQSLQPLSQALTTLNAALNGPLPANRPNVVNLRMAATALLPIVQTTLAELQANPGLATSNNQVRVTLVNALNQFQQQAGLVESQDLGALNASITNPLMSTVAAANDVASILDASGSQIASELQNGCLVDTNGLIQVPANAVFTQGYAAASTLPTPGGFTYATPQAPGGYTYATPQAPGGYTYASPQSPVSYQAPYPQPGAQYYSAPSNQVYASGQGYYQPSYSSQYYTVGKRTCPLIGGMLRNGAYRMKAGAGNILGGVAIAGKGIVQTTVGGGQVVLGTTAAVGKGVVRTAAGAARLGGVAIVGAARFIKRDAAYLNPFNYELIYDGPQRGYMPMYANQYYQ